MLEVAVLSSVACGIPVVDPSHEAAIAIAKELLQPKKIEQPKDTIAEIMDAEAQRDRGIAIAVGATVAVVGGIIAGASAGAVMHVGRQNRLGEAKEKVAQYEVQRERAWDCAEYYPLTSQVLTGLVKCSKNNRRLKGTSGKRTLPWTQRTSMNSLKATRRSVMLLPLINGVILLI